MKSVGRAAKAEKRGRATFLRCRDTWYNRKLKNSRLWPSDLREGEEDGDGDAGRANQMAEDSTGQGKKC